jgi:hypothetical protein
MQCEHPILYPIKKSFCFSVVNTGNEISLLLKAKHFPNICWFSDMIFYDV